MDPEGMDWERFWVIIDACRREEFLPPWTLLTRTLFKKEILNYWQDKTIQEFPSGYVVASCAAFSIPFMDLPKHVGSSVNIGTKAVVRFRLEVGV